MSALLGPEVPGNEVQGTQASEIDQAAVPPGQDDELPKPSSATTDAVLPTISGPSTAEIYSGQGTEDEQPSHGVDATCVVPPPHFRPYFVLIEDPETGEQHHPEVHYVFSDDDPEPLTSAMLSVITASGDGGATAPTATSDERAARRTVVVDMHQDGKHVVHVSSLSPDWQALTTDIVPAPSWGDDDNGQQGLVMKISGHDPSRDGSQSEAIRNLKNETDVCTLLKEFDGRLAILDNVLNFP